MTTTETKREREARRQRRLLFSKMILCAEQSNRNKQICRPNKSHLPFCGQWFEDGVHFSFFSGEKAIRVFSDDFFNYRKVEAVIREKSMKIGVPHMRAEGHAFYDISRGAKGCYFSTNAPIHLKSSNTDALVRTNLW
jgi:hypothetical protein